VAVLLSVQSTSSPCSIDLIHRVDTAIRRNPHLNGNQVFFQEESGVVVLHGKVSSFFQKQMAQETIKRLDGVERIVNQLEVDWRSSVQC
jgi:osmotically-inducible protein OsmY